MEKSSGAGKPKKKIISKKKDHSTKMLGGRATAKEVQKHFIRHRSNGTMALDVYRPSGLVCYPQPPVKLFSAFATGGVVSNPMESLVDARGQIQLDKGEFALEASTVAKASEFSVGTSVEALGLVWRYPMTFKNTANGAIHPDVRGTLIDICHIDVEFENLTAATMAIYGTTPLTDTVEGTNIVARSNHVDLRELKPKGKHTHRITFQNTSDLRFPLQGAVAGFDPRDATFANRCIRLLDFIVVVNDVNEMAGAEYPATEQLVAVRANVVYVSTLRTVSSQYGGTPATLVPADYECFALQALDSQFAIAYTDARLVTATNAIVSCPDAAEDRVVRRPGTLEGHVETEGGESVVAVKMADGSVRKIPIVTGWKNTIKSIINTCGVLLGVAKTILSLF